MAKKLTRLKINEVSSVDRGAGEGVRVMLMKRDGKAPLGGMVAKLVSLFVGGEVKKAATALGSSVRSIVDDTSATNKSELVERSLGEFTDHVLGIVPGEVEKALAAGSAADTSEDDQMSAAIKKALGLADSATEAEVTAAIAKLAPAENKDKDARIAKLEGELEVAKAGLSDDERAHHDALKSDDDKAAFRKLSRDERTKIVKAARAQELPEHVRKALQEGEDLKKRLAALEDKDALTGFTKRAVEIDLPEAEGATIQKAYRGDKEAVDKLLGFIKAAHAQAKAAGIFKELGDNRPGAGTTALDELNAKSGELRKKDAALTQEQAFAKVYQDPANAELVKRERAENRPAAA